MVLKLRGKWPDDPLSKEGDIVCLGVRGSTSEDRSGFFERLFDHA
jgi:hypothetical protein